MLHRIKILLSILSILTYLTAEKTYSQHIVFNEITSEQDWLSVLKKSETEKKPVFLDIYASWCGPCKKMDAEVFANPNVADFYNENFINSKIDGESPFGVILVREFMLKGFPSMYYVDSEKFIYSKLVGFRPPEIFLDYGKTINNNKDLLKEFALSFETGRLHGEKIKEYIDLLTRIDYKEPIAKINTLFINSMNTREILLPGNKEMIINSALQFESEPFRIILEQHDTLMALWGEEDYLKFLENVFQEGIQKAAKEENVSLRDRLADELIPVYFRFDT